MTGAPPGGGSRDIHDVEALITDRYLDAILAAHGRGADGGLTAAASLPDSDVRLAADWLARALPRFHPSFRFEEALAAKLNEVVARMRPALAAGGEGRIVPLTGRAALVPALSADEDDPIRRADPRLALGRPLLIGGALTSAALSLGAAYLAWRIRHPQASPMARAIRAVARTRTA